MFDQFRLSTKDAEEGVWCEFANGVAFLIRSSRRQAVREATRTKNKPYARQLQMGNAPLDRIEDNQKQVYAEHCVAGWRGVAESEGEFSAKRILEVFRDPELSDIWDFCREAADNLKWHADAALEEAEKN